MLAWDLTINELLLERVLCYMWLLKYGFSLQCLSFYCLRNPHIYTYVYLLFRRSRDVYIYWVAGTSYGHFFFFCFLKILITPTTTITTFRSTWHLYYHYSTVAATPKQTRLETQKLRERENTCGVQLNLQGYHKAMSENLYSSEKQAKKSTSAHLKIFISEFHYTTEEL